MPSPQSPAPPPGGGVLLDSQEIMDEAARIMGILCSMCHGPLSGVAYEFVSLKPISEGSEVVVKRERFLICDRDRCAEARAKAREGSTACRSIAGGWELPGAAVVVEDASGE